MQSYLRRLSYWVHQVIHLPFSLASQRSLLSLLKWCNQQRIYRIGYLLAVVWVGLAGQADGQTITTVAGYNVTEDGGPAINATLKSPSSVAVDKSGNLYIADYSSNCVRKVNAAGIISTVAGNGSQSFGGDGGAATKASLNNPTSVAVDSLGNLYITDINNYRIRKVSTGGTISTVAGNGIRGFSGDGGAAIAASLFYPTDVAVDKRGNIYIADPNNNRIRMVNAAGIISTVAGNGNYGFNGDGDQAISASLSNPNGVAVDSLGNLYIADYNNYRIRKVSLGGIISTVAGNGKSGFSGDGGAATAASLFYPTDVAVDKRGNIYVVDPTSNRIRKVSATGIISTVAGNGTSGFSGDGGPATVASLNFPSSVAVDKLGNLYIADEGNSRIRKMSTAGIINTVAGIETVGSSGDGGPATEARLYLPSSVAVDESGNLYIAGYNSSRIRKVNVAGIISTIAGNGSGGFSGDGGPATAASLSRPTNMVADKLGNLYFTDYESNRIRRVSAGGIISTVAGSGTNGFSGDGGPATVASLNNLTGVAVDSLGNLYIADSGNNRIRKVEPNTAPTVANAVVPQSVTVGLAYSLSLASTFTDAETPNALTITVAGLPASLNLNGAIIAGTPDTPLGGPYSVTATVTDPGGLSASTTFTIRVIPYVSSTPTGTFGITGVTTVTCTASMHDQRSLTFIPQYTGLTGASVTFQVVNQLVVATTSPGPYTLVLNPDNPIITLKAVQDGVTSIYIYNWLVACNNTIPLSVEPVVPLYLKVLGNPVLETLDVEVSGAAGGSLDLRLIDSQGRVVGHQSLKHSAPLERVQLKMGGLPTGVFVLQVTTPRQSQRVRIVKKE